MKFTVLFMLFDYLSASPLQPQKMVPKVIAMYHCELLRYHCLPMSNNRIKEAQSLLSEVILQQTNLLYIQIVLELLQHEDIYIICVSNTSTLSKDIKQQHQGVMELGGRPQETMWGISVVIYQISQRCPPYYMYHLLLHSYITYMLHRINDWHA